MIDLVVFGDPVLDHVYRLADPIRSGGKMLGQYDGAFPGGTTANLACAAARLGISTTLVGRVAAGLESRFHRQSLAEFDVNTDRLLDLSVERGAHTIITLEPGGEKTLVYVPLAGEAIPSPIVAEAVSHCRLAYIMAVDLKLVAGHLPRSETLLAIDVDAAAGLALQEYRNAAGKADIIFINSVGFQKLAGYLPDEERLTTMLGERTSLLCCTGGAGTTYLLDRTGGATKVHSRQALPAETVDTTGAGDCFNAAFLAEILGDRSPESALDFAMAAGALAVEVDGTKHAIPTREAVMRRMAGSR